jgi:PAS domain S-box-containing protein
MKETVNKKEEMIPDIIQTLLIEDDPDDVLLLKESLAKAKAVMIKLTHVDRLSNGLIQLAEQHYDVVLLDLNLPDSRGLETLTTITTGFPKIPVVVLSGLRDDFTTLRAIKYGAQDYLVKGEFSGLMLARVLRYAVERKQAEMVIGENEERFRRIFEEGPLGMTTANSDYRFIRVNKTFCRMIGYSEQELQYLTFKDITHPKHIAHDMEMVKKLFNGEIPIYRTEKRYIHKDKKIVWASVTIATIRDKNGQFMYFLDMVEDITDRKRAEGALRESEGRYRLITEHMADQIWVMSLNLRTVFCTSSVVRARGYSFEELVSLPMDKQLTPTSRQVLAEFRLQMLTPEKLKQKDLDVSQSLELEFVKKDGSTFWSEVQLNLIRDADGQPLSLLCAGRDISERKQSEAEARRLSSFPELNPTPILEISMDGEVIYANPATLATLAQIDVTDTRAFLPDDFANILKTADATHTQFRRLVKIKGLTFGETVNYTPEFQSMRLHARDITESMQIEEALRESEQQYRMLIENLGEGIAMLDNEASFFFTNQAAENTFGFQTGGLLRHNLREFLTPEQFEVVTADMKKHSLGEKTTYELEITRQDGQKRSLLVTTTPQYASDKTSTATFCIFRDITEREQAELALQKLNAELEQRVDERTAELSAANAALARASRLKDEFLASMSHELRTPLTAVLNLSEALQEQTYGPLTEKQFKSLRTIEESGRHLLGLINDILDLSQVEAGYLNLKIDECSVVDICQSSLQLVKGMAQKKQQNISFVSSPETFKLRADPRRLKQMLVNLLSNAIKFTPEGGLIGLSVEAYDIDKVVQFTVWDNGIGIATEDLPKLFRPFIQLDSGLSRQQAGTGLGLALVQRMADLHGGSVRVESTPGKGSRFTIILPWITTPLDYMPSNKRTTGFLRHQTQPLTSQSMASDSPPLILLADDNETSVNTYSDYLQAKGFQVAVAHHGEEAIRMAEKVYPDLILMDIQMPGVNGLEATRRIRRHPDQRIASIPVIALTALAMPGDRELCLGAGANEYLSKPVSLAVLIRAIETQLARALPLQTGQIVGKGS